jgi:hypothetical protein
MKRDAGVAAFFVALAVAMTWPLARIITRGVANPGDPYQQTFVLDWDWFATFHRPLHLFQANIFYPAKDTLAYGEHLYGIAIFLFPLRMLGISALTTHNLALILGFAFSGFAGYLLGRTVTGNAIAGVAAGIFYAYLPWRFTQLPHLNYVWAAWLPMLIVALVYCARRPGWRSAALFGAVFLMNGLTNLYLFAFGSIAVGLAVPILVRDRRQWLRIGAATLVALALITPFLIPYFRVRRETGMQWTWADVKSWSAEPRDWLNPGATNRFYRRFFDPKSDPELWLFPGALGIAMSGLGVVAARRERRMLAVALLWFGLGFIGSLGVHAFFHRFLFSHVPGFGSLRVAARWATIAYAGMTMLVAYGAAWRKWLGVLASALFLVELHAAPIRWHCVSQPVPPVYQWLKTQQGPIAELPMGGEIENRYLRFATEHHLPMVNGMSSFVPRRFLELANEPREKQLDDLRKMGVRLIIIHDEDADRVGAITFRQPTTGALDEPAPNAYLRYKARFAGRARSSYGVRQVNLLFDNGSVRVPTTLTGSSFVAELTQRPPNIDRDTDVQVEIIDGRGERTLLEGRWFWWGP